jgi:hypothetical protein
MTRNDALARLQKRGLRCEVGKVISSPERRAEARQRYDQANAAREDLARRIREQFGDEDRAIKERHDRAQREMSAYKFRVYRPDGPFYMEVGKGDTWEEAFASIKVEKGGA